MLRLFAVLAAVLATSARADEVCDSRAKLAGRIMELRQAGTAQALEEAVQQAGDRLVAADLAARAYAQELGADADADAREAANYHFAADVYQGCRRDVALAHYAAV